MGDRWFTQVMVLTGWKICQLQKKFFLSMYKMSSGAKRLTQIREITVGKYSESKIHTICVNKRGVNALYVIWRKMSDLQENVDLQNLSHLSWKK